MNFERYKRKSAKNYLEINFGNFVFTSRQINKAADRELHKQANYLNQLIGNRKKTKDLTFSSSLDS